MPSKPNIPRTCQRCGSAFLAYKNQIEKGWGKFCSPACARNPTPAERPCEYCGNLFAPTNIQLRNGHGRCCSRKCAGRQQWKGHTPKPGEPRAKSTRISPSMILCLPVSLARPFIGTTSAIGISRRFSKAQNYLRHSDSTTSGIHALPCFLWPA